MTVLANLLNGGSGKDYRDTLNTLIPLGRRNPNAAAINGDSRSENVATAVGALSRISTRSLQNPLTWYQALTGQRLRLVYNGGISGARSDQYLSANSPHTDIYSGVNNIDAMIQSSAMWAIFAGLAVNDFSQGKLADDIWPALKAAFDKCIANGMHLILFAEAGGSGLNAAAVAQVHRFNALLRAYCALRPQSILVDVPSAVWSPAATSTTAITQRALFYGDGTHFLVRGAYAAARAMIAAVGGRIPPLDKLPSSPTEILANGAMQLYDKPLLTPAATTMSTPTWVTYNSQVPAGLSFFRQLNGNNSTGAATCTVDMVTTSDGYPGLRMVSTFTQAGEALGLDLNLTDLTTLVTGDQYYAVGQIDVAAGATASIGMYRIQFTPNGGTQAFSYDLYNDYAPNFGAFPQDAMTLVAETTPLAVPAMPTGMTSAGIRLKTAATGGAGTITTVLSRVGFRALRPA